MAQAEVLLWILSSINDLPIYKVVNRSFFDCGNPRQLSLQRDPQLV